MGPVVDRSQEHLGPADRAIIIARRLLLEACRAVEEGKDPRGADRSYYGARAIEKIFPNTQSWRDTVLPEMAVDVPLAAD